MKILVAFSYCGEHIKSVIGRIDALNHMKCLMACMDNVNNDNKYPMLVSATKFSIDNRNENERMLSWELLKKATVISTNDNPGHQQGACWTVRYAMEFAGYMGYDYMFYTADDIVFDNPTVVEDTITTMIENELGYIGSTWGGGGDLSTQIFGIKVSDFVDIEKRMFLFNPIVFISHGSLLEQYMFHVIKNYGIKHKIYKIRYFHNHNPEEVLNAAKIIKETGKLNFVREGHFDKIIY
jgi:hypothetical protein